jgi:hypothetical protein
MAIPDDLGADGALLWERAERALPEEWELDTRGEAILALAAHQADDLGRLEVAIKENGTMVTGSKGQPVMNPAIGEARQARLAISRLLGTLPFEEVDPDLQDKPKNNMSVRNQRAARIRWEKATNRD